MRQTISPIEDRSEIPIRRMIFKKYQITSKEEVPQDILATNLMIKQIIRDTIGATKNQMEWAVLVDICKKVKRGVKTIQRGEQ